MMILVGRDGKDECQMANDEGNSKSQIGERSSGFVMTDLDIGQAVGHWACGRISGGKCRGFFGL
jgi:hypothetical protein